MASYKGQITLVKVNDGAEGASGQTLYTWIKYADDAIGTNISDDPTGKSYIGLAYNQTSKEESSNYEDYDWALIKGEDGIPGEDGQDGQTLYTWIKYADDETGLGISDNPEGKLYIGLAYNRESQIESEDPSEYTWALIKGEDGVPGADGRDSQKFRVETNQDEILKFYQDEEVVFSPKQLTISVSTENSDEKISFPSEFSESGSDGILKRVKISFVGRENSFTFFLGPLEETAKVIYYDENEAGEEISLEGEVQIKRDYYSFSSDKKELQLDLDKFIAFGEEYKSLEFVDDYNNIYQEVKTAFTFGSDKGESVLKFEVQLFENDYTYRPLKIIIIRYGMNEDMAKLSLKADGLYASMQNSQLVFSEDGLTIKNGHFAIVKENGTEIDKLLYTDGSGNLTLRGNIYATDGEFSGVIKAKQGEIGGFRVEESYLTSTDKDTEGEKRLGSIVLEGATGKIIAENIEIGENASIQNYINLGDNVRLQNPAVNSNKGKFVSVYNNDQPIIEMSQTGLISLGDGAIVLDGLKKKITGENWFITPELAQFSNVNITGAIKAASFEYGVVQSIGGMLFVRPSSKIKSIDGANIYFETSQSGGFKIDDWCLLQTSDYSKFYYRVSSIITDNNLVIGLTLKTNTGEETSINTDFIGAILINLGETDGEKGAGSVGIGINGSTNNTFLAPNAISVVTPNWDDNAKTMNLNSHIILGKLPNEEIYGYAAGTYGLYADNVVLRGQITTGTDAISKSYCGLGTTGKTASVKDIINYENMFPNREVGKIVLWAGADNPNAIKNSNFFVDEYGNIFANSGYFRGTIISESTIEAAEIKTAIITGTGPGSDGKGLIIRDVSTGIDFQNETGNSYFKLSTSGLKIGLPTIIEKSVGISGKLTVSEVLTNDNLSISSNLIQRDGAILKIGKPIVSTKADDLASTQSAFDFTIGQDKVFQLNSEEISIWGNVQYKNQDNEVVYEYRKAFDENNKIIGCDIFVYE